MIDKLKDEINELTKETTEYGQGLTYCLGLFLSHAERKDNDDHQIWFNGAADHLYDLLIPDFLPDDLKTELESFKRICIKWRMETYTKEDKRWAIEKAKYFLLIIDKHLNINAIEAQWK